jgi:ribokinase
VLATAVVVGPGGKGLNQAVAAQRLSRPGARAVRMIGRVGDDGFGAALRSFMDEEDIDATGVVTSAGTSTGLGLITVDAGGQNAITVVPGANMVWPSTPPAFALATGDFVLAQLEIPQAVTLAGLQAARVVRATTILNPAPYAPIDPAILAATDVLILNEIEATQAAGAAHDAGGEATFIGAARALLARGPGTVVVTLGAAGALVVEANGRAVRLPAEVVTAVDTTGAGDCFVGAFAVALREGADAVTAAAFANRAAGLSVTRAGAALGLPRRRDLKS